MPVKKRARRDPEWYVYAVDSLAGGMNTGLRSDQLPDEKVPRLQNFYTRQGRTTKDTGTKRQTTSAFFGTIQKHFTHKDNSGIVSQLIITQRTVYRFVTDEWILVPWDDAAAGDTTLTVDMSAGHTSITVAAIANFSVGDIIGIQLDQALGVGQGYHVTTVAAPAPAGNNINLTDAVPFGKGATSGNTVTEGILLAGTDDTQVVSVASVAKEWSVHTNDIDPPFYFTSSTGKVKALDTSSYTGGAISSVRTMVIHKGALVFANVVAGGARQGRAVIWSDLDDIEQWDSTGTAATAGFNTLAETRDDIEAIAKLGDSALLYGQGGSIVAMSFLEGELGPFRFTTAVSGEDITASGVGVASPNSVVDFEGAHYYIGPAGCFRYRGGPSVETISEEIYRDFFDMSGEISRELIRRAFTVQVHERNEIGFFYVRATSSATFPDSALFYNVMENTWRLRSFSTNFEVTSADVRNKDSATESISWDSFPVGERWIDQPAGVPWVGRITSGAVPVIALGVLKGSEVRLLDYDYITSKDDGAVISSVVETKDFASLDRDQRFDWLDIQMRARATQILVSLDQGKTYTQLGVFDDESAFVRKRFHRQMVSERIRFMIVNKGGPCEIGSLVFRLREESRFNVNTS